MLAILSETRGYNGAAWHKRRRKLQPAVCCHSAYSHTGLCSLCSFKLLSKNNC
jgi:hypothetical protein